MEQSDATVSHEKTYNANRNSDVRSILLSGVTAKLLITLYMRSFSEWTIFHFQCWSLLIEAIDPKTSCLDWLLGGNAGITGICVCERKCDCESLEGGKEGISLMKSYRKSMSYWKKKNALPRGGCTWAHTQKKKKKKTHTHLTVRQSVMSCVWKKTKAFYRKVKQALRCTYTLIFLIIFSDNLLQKILYKLQTTFCTWKCTKKQGRFQESKCLIIYGALRQSL